MAEYFVKCESCIHNKVKYNEKPCSKCLYLEMYQAKGVVKVMNGDKLVLKEIPYPKRKIKWSYDVIEDTRNIFEKNRVLPSRVVLREIIKGTTVELIDEDDSTAILKKI